MLHVLIWIGWCLVPALVLIPLRFLDRGPANGTAHESGDGQDGASKTSRVPC